ncbi:MAG: hypothetical protein J1E43_09260 [Christensenellaceae bacterium]|nr:hypothetical protein [Christensenellaceae bacterium]
MRFTWSPMEGVTVATTIAPVGMWHIRKHVIRAEGAFAVKKDWAGARPCDRIASALTADDRRAAAHGTRGASAIRAIEGYDRGEAIHPERSTNLMRPARRCPRSAPPSAPARPR